MVLRSDVLCDGVTGLSVGAALSCAGEGYNAVRLAGTLGKNTLAVSVTDCRDFNLGVNV